MNAWWIAITRGYPVGDLPQRCEIAVAEHNKIVESLSDQPLIGAEVRALRLKYESDEDR
jgi:hypothetical protein